MNKGYGQSLLRGKNSNNGQIMGGKISTSLGSSEGRYCSDENSYYQVVHR